MNCKTAQHILLLLIILILLCACSGGETGTGVVADQNTTVSVGRVTSLDNVRVNGVIYSIDQATFSLDDVNGSVADLEVGMVVAIQGMINEDKLTGEASHIEYRDVLEAIVLDTTINNDGVGTLNVVGQTVIVDTLTTFDSGVQDISLINQLIKGNVVEVSGFTSGNGIIYATRVDLKAQFYTAGNEIELKGIISGLTVDSFILGQLTVDYSNAQMSDFPPEGMADGQFIQVKSIEGLDMDGRLIASNIGLEGDGNINIKLDEGVNIHIEGVVTTFVKPQEEFILNGQLIKVTSETRMLNGDIGDIVETSTLIVEGRINTNGIIVADTILFVGIVDISMDAYVESVDAENNTLVVLGQTVLVNNFTTMKDRRDKNGFVAVRYFTIYDVEVGNRISLDIEELTSKNYVASKLERRDIKNTVVKLEGRLDMLDINRLSVAGVDVDTSFSGLINVEIMPGDLVKVKGTYDEVMQVLTATDVSKRNCKRSWICF